MFGSVCVCVCSTPYRTSPPSLHDELSRHGELMGRALPSPLVGVIWESCRLEDRLNTTATTEGPGQITLEDLEHVAQNSVSSSYHL